MAADNATHGKQGGDVMIRLRGLGVIPADKAQIDKIGGDTDLSNTVVPELDVTYFFTRHLAAELIAATTRHDVKVKDTALGDQKLGRVSLLPPTLLAQWHFLPDAKFSPYVGAGINYTIFYDSKESGIANSLKFDNSFGWALQAGMDVQIVGNWYLNVDVKKLFLNTNAEVNRSIDAKVDVDPWLIGLGLGYKF
ncbi:outer membrane protein [Arboricoccus pini]|uniref:Outer membrane protein n=2 Tax=Arboricoccus pini TaxID=1963835 RepID=A0A212RRZ5_9PROT|nr:outer membrane protein [Arboricoccus pini]